MSQGLYPVWPVFLGIMRRRSIALLLLFICVQGSRIMVSPLERPGCQEMLSDCDDNLWFCCPGLTCLSGKCGKCSNDMEECQENADCCSEHSECHIIDGKGLCRYCIGLTCKIQSDCCTGGFVCLDHTCATCHTLTCNKTSDCCSDGDDYGCFAYRCQICSTLDCKNELDCCSDYVCDGGKCTSCSGIPCKNESDCCSDYGCYGGNCINCSAISCKNDSVLQWLWVWRR